MRLPTLAPLAALALAFAGCTGSPDLGITAKEAVAIADPAAQAWAADAVLLDALANEVAGYNASEAAALGYEGTPVDPAVGDGRSPLWIVSYHSASLGKRLVLAVESGGTRVNADAPLAGEPEPAPREAWTVDSPAAAQAVRSDAFANETLCSAKVRFTLVFGHEGWRFIVDTEERVVQGFVDVVEGTLTESACHLKSEDRPCGPPLPPLPAPIHETGDVTAAVDPLPIGGQEPCQTPGQACVEVPFTLDRDATITATLTWGTDANDFDLYVMDGSGIVLTSGATPPGTEESIDDALEAGDYRLVVAPYAVANDTWTLDATFS
jgi:hypothetical protein